MTLSVTTAYLVGNCGSPLLDGGWGLGGNGLGRDDEGLGLDGRGSVLGIGLRDGAIALGEDARCHERLHKAAHHGVAHELQRWPDVEQWGAASP